MRDIRGADIRRSIFFTANLSVNPYAVTQRSHSMFVAAIAECGVNYGSYRLRQIHRSDRQRVKGASISLSRNAICARR